MRRAFLLYLAALLAACATGARHGPETPLPVDQPSAGPAQPPDPDAALKEEVGALRASATALLAAQAELVWRSWAQGEPVDFAAAAAGREALFVPQALAKVRALRQKVREPAQARALRALELYLAGEQIAQATAEDSDAVAHLLATATLSVDGQEIAFRDLESLLAGEGHLGNRRKLAKAAEPVARKLAAALAKREKRLAEAVAAAGFPSVLAYQLALRRVDEPAGLAALAEQVLSRTEVSYRAALEERCKRELGLALSEVRRADVPRLLRTGEVDTYFPKEKQLEGLTAALSAMGLGPAAMPQLSIDGKPQLRRNPRALAVSLAAGKDVRLSLRPASGLTAAAQAFHEAGHAVQAAATKVEAAEFAALGPGAVGEAAGYLFEDLLDDPQFAEAAGVPAAKVAAHGRASALRKLLLARRLAGRLLFEISWRSGTVQGSPEQAYREVMARALGFPAEPEDGARWLVDSEDYLAAADALRGLLSSAQLRAALASELGPRWWADPRAGSRIAGWFAPGTQPTVEELVQSVNARGLEVEPFAASLEALLAAAPPAPKKGPGP